MDQQKIGQFIKSLRKAKNLTQEQLAERLRISSKTVSKWECGSGLPEVSLMLSLCEVLGISVNELLSGSLLNDSEYKRKAEDNLIVALTERKSNRRLMVVQLILGSLIVISSLSLMIAGSLLGVEVWEKILLNVLGGVIIIAGIACLCVLDIHTGYFRCPHCHETFVPTTKAYVMGMHTIRKRRLTCPHCHTKGWCLKVMSKNESSSSGEPE
jgi:Predicted transcriptional regulators